MSVSHSSPSLLAKQSSSNSIPSCKVYFSTIAENCFGHGAFGGDDGGGDGGGGGVWGLCGMRSKMVTHWKRFSGSATGRRLQIFFKEQFKKDRSHLMI